MFSVFDFSQRSCLATRNKTQANLLGKHLFLRWRLRHHIGLFPFHLIKYDVYQTQDIRAPHHTSISILPPSLSLLCHDKQRSCPNTAPLPSKTLQKPFPGNLHIVNILQGCWLPCCCDPLSHRNNKALFAELPTSGTQRQNRGWNEEAWRHKQINKPLTASG